MSSPSANMERQTSQLPYTDGPRSDRYLYQIPIDRKNGYTRFIGMQEGQICSGLAFAHQLADTYKCHGTEKAFSVSMKK